MIKFLKPIRENRSHEEVIYRRIKQFFDDLLFNYMKEVVKDNRLENALDLRTLLRRGEVVYENGVFKFERPISNKVAKELEQMGAKYSRARKGYVLAPKKLPVVIAQTVAEVNIHNAEKVKRIESYLNNIQDSKDFAYDQLNFDVEVEKIGTDLDKQFADSVKPVLEIAPKMTEFQKSEIAKNYTNNLAFYIRKFADEEIVKLRQEIQPLVIAGYRAESLEKIIKKREGISARKAKFLARQETRLLVAEYTKNRMKQAGITRFRWRTVLDGRERPEHKALNGQIFSWSEPPIIDARTGERGYPSQAFNCRCWAEPVIEWTTLNNDKEDVNGCWHGDDGKFIEKNVVDLTGKIRVMRSLSEDEITQQIEDELNKLLNNPVKTSTPPLQIQVIEEQKGHIKRTNIILKGGQIYRHNAALLSLEEIVRKSHKDETKNGEVDLSHNTRQETIEHKKQVEKYIYFDTQVLFNGVGYIVELHTEQMKNQDPHVLNLYHIRVKRSS